MTDPIADMLTQVKNAAHRGRASLVIPHSRIKQEIAEILTKAGYLSAVSQKGKRVKKYLELELAMKGGVARVSDVKRISKPGKRVYYGVSEIRPVREGRGLAVFSTPKGLLSDKQARKEGVGGELLFQIW